MASPENLQSPSSFSPTKPKLTEALAAIDQQLERAAGIENPLERFFKQDQLLERKDELQAEIDEAASSPEYP
jgi:hypothetical protein